LKTALSIGPMMSFIFSQWWSWSQWLCVFNNVSDWAS